ncbi:hypothetical protein NDA10_005537 [Ustilago hordei]|nr:hypothetical protein NDA10_005537 [Ustilago hordei]
MASHPLLAPAPPSSARISPPLLPPCFTPHNPSQRQPQLSSNGWRTTTGMQGHIKQSGAVSQYSGPGTSTLASPPWPSAPTASPGPSEASGIPLHNRRMFRAAFCLAFACLLCSGEFTWETSSSPPLLTVGSVAFAEDGSYATILLPSSKMDPFGTGVMLTAPVVPLPTCAVKALQVICRHCLVPEPLFALDGGMPFDRKSFITTIHRCLQMCGIPPKGYSGHSFWRGAATWAAANRIDSSTIQGLGRWCSDCFWHYVDTSAAERAVTSAHALYANTDQPLDLSRPAWRNF